MSGDYVLYGGGVTQATAVEALLEELALPYDLRAVDIVTRQNRSAAFLDVNPAGFVPALVTPEGETLHETAAILLYLCDRHADAGLAPAISDPLRGRFLSRLHYIGYELQAPAKRVFYPHRFSTDRADIPRIVQAARKMGLERWRIYDGWLAAEGPFCLGARFSAADILMAVWAAYGFKHLTEITDACPAVAQCYLRVLERPRAGPPLRRLRSLLSGGVAGRGAPSG